MICRFCSWLNYWFVFLVFRDFLVSDRVMCFYFYSGMFIMFW